MIVVRQTRQFSKWFTGLRDTRARARITVRIDRLALGNPGNVSPVGEGISQLKISYGPGYRLYYVQKGEELAILLCGGHKGSQPRDIAAAKALAKKLED
ncbi:MAG: type II toxin-antitoxin system RelE/ParE family toxin [Alphaproteobacteria bacterium]